MTDDNTDPTPAPASDDLGEAGKKALQVERARAAAAEKATRALQAQLDEATSRMGILEATNGDLNSQITELGRTNLRMTVGLEKGLPASLIDRLRGDDEIALQADAEALLALIPNPTSPGPRPDPSQGARPSGATDPKAAFTAFMGPLMNP